MEIDLSGPAATVESLMVDTCRITVENPTTDTIAQLDPVTLRPLVDPSTEPAPRYEGPCLLGGSADSPTVALPLSFLRDNPQAEPRPGDMLTVVEATRDPTAAGRRYLVAGRPATSTFALTRRLNLTPVAG